MYCYVFLRNKYRPAYDNADRVVLLSEKYISDYSKCAGVVNDGRICSISNSLVFDNQFDISRYNDFKRHEVLWVGRLEDRTKRFSEALRVWQIIERSKRFNDWIFRIVGYGEDEMYFHHLIKRLNLKNVIYEGHSESLPYYQSASIFLMTSAYEGFGNVLTESLQNAVIPIAFDSYKALHDIIEDGKNGFIVPDHDRKSYADCLMQLMSAPELRKRVAEQGVKSTSKFSVKKIVKDWEVLLESLA